MYNVQKYKLCQKTENCAKLPYKGSFFVTFWIRDGRKKQRGEAYEIIDLVEKISSDSRYLEFAPNIYLGENKRKIKKAIEEEGNFVNKKRKVKKI